MGGRFGSEHSEAHLTNRPNEGHQEMCPNEVARSNGREKS
jgi:hypothetical protein